ncbi:PAS domain-containing protein [Streptomyces sp. NPDC088137]|uniref:PAS domain-containing protein n=1 Tax=Streptomyces sp. NPDC088137 TaxID=3365827 RepID=UPI0037F8EB63
MNSRSFQGGTHLAAVLDALPDGLLLIDRNGTVISANAAAHDMFEAPGTPLVGHGLRDLLPDHGSRMISGTLRGADDHIIRWGRDNPPRMTAHRTDGGEFPAEVITTNLETGHALHDPGRNHSDDELLLLMVRDLTGARDTEAALVRSQRQTEVILRATTEGLIGTDTKGRVVLVNPAAARILGFRASDLDGRELHPLVLHSTANGEPNPFVETPLAATLVSGLKCQAHDQALWTKAGDRISADVTTIPVWDGEQLVGTIMAFTDRGPFEKLIGEHAVETTRQKKKYDELSERHQQLESELAALQEQLRLEREKNTSDKALARNTAGLDGVVGSGIGPAAEFTGPGRTRFAVHAPPVGVEADRDRIATALAHRPSPVAARQDASRQISPVAGSWIIGAAVRAQRERRPPEQQPLAALSGRPLRSALLRAASADEAIPQDVTDDPAFPPRAWDGSPTPERRAVPPTATGPHHSAGRHQSGEPEGMSRPLTPHSARQGEGDGGSARKRLAVLLTGIRNRPN